MDLNINLNLPEPANKFLNPIAEKAAITMSALWEIAFGQIGYWQKKKALKREKDFLDFKQEFEKEYVRIPPENLKEPQLSLVGPALEASKYYIEEKIIRNMFAKLIAASIDTRKNGLVHHAFVDIIKQMNPNDAKLLLDFSNPTTLLYCLIKRSDNAVASEYISDIYLSDSMPEFNQDNSLSVNNLERLGLLYIPTRNLGSLRMSSIDEDIKIQKFKNTVFYKQLLTEFQDPTLPRQSCEIVCYEAYLTQLAFSFKTVCL
uniref:DUF4393 domain-containing protein n=1 Tax=Caudovirales sp. ctkvU4 TaxID=2826783 RepID=A0A8S5QPR1_9CAUD|nr:MAG TPA: protein of unknown function (DUF4393) [Caudovirales sp. ctkvU4]